jgi:hypothetical protein
LITDLTPSGVVTDQVRVLVIQLSGLPLVRQRVLWASGKLFKDIGTRIACKQLQSIGFVLRALPDDYSIDSRWTRLFGQLVEYQRQTARGLLWTGNESRGPGIFVRNLRALLVATKAHFFTSLRFYHFTNRGATSLYCYTYPSCTRRWRKWNPLRRSCELLPPFLYYLLFYQLPSLHLPDLTTRTAQVDYPFSLRLQVISRNNMTNGAERRGLDCWRRMQQELDEAAADSSFNHHLNLLVRAVRQEGKSPTGIHEDFFIRTQEQERESRKRRTDQLKVRLGPSTTRVRQSPSGFATHADFGLLLVQLV